MSMGLLLIRLVVGLLLAGHGAQKLFGWFDGHGIAGTGGWLESLGYRPGRRHAVVAGASEIVGGVLLALGLLTPLGAAIAVGVMVNAAGSVHWRNGLWVTDNGIEYPLVLAAVAAGLAFTGAGATSLDAALDVADDLRGGGWGLAAIASGVVVGAVVLASRSGEPQGRSDEVRGDAEADTLIHAASR